MARVQRGRDRAACRTRGVRGILDGGDASAPNEVFIDKTDNAYKNSYFNILTESSFVESDIEGSLDFYLNERNVFPINAFQPYIAVNGQGHMKELKKDDLLKHFEKKKLLGGSCHNEKEISLASNLGLNYCILGPIKDKLIDKKIITKGIGWDKFSDMAKKSLIKIYAIGGLSNDDLEIASKYYACGIAGISMFYQSS